MKTYRIKQLFLLVLFLYQSFNGIAYNVTSYLSGGSIPNPGSRTLNTSYKVGATSGVFDVSGTGAATYNIPLFVAPGTAGIQPVLSLHYGSNNSYSILGKGWSLSGLSAIYRVPSDSYRDGVTDPVDFDTYDAFMLDGLRLIKDGSVYKTEQENYSVITPVYSGSAIVKFIVKTKDGGTIEYGTDNAKLQNGTNSRYFTWYITKIQDANGNYMTYVYANDATYGLRLTEIDYTGNTAAGLATYNSVTFTYSVRNDVRYDYVYGQEVKYNLLLTQVKSLAQGSTARTYDLNFILDDGESLLAEVIETGSDGTRYNSTIFNYHDYQSNGQTVALNLTDNFSKKIYGDINGDGRSDLIAKYGDYIKYYTSNASGAGVTYQGQLNVGTSDYEVGDFNGDGMEDIVVSSSSGIKYYKSTGTGFSYVGTSDVSLSGITKMYAYDVTGDHITDIILQTSTKLYVYKGDATDPFNSGFNGTFNWGDDAYFYDFTGDGKNELAIRYGSEQHFYQFSNTDFTAFYSGTDSGTEMIFGDFNGDGRMDFIQGNSKKPLNLFIGNGYISNGKTFLKKSFVMDLDLKKANITAFDSNNDGIYEVYAYTPDVVPYDPDTYSADEYIYNGTGFGYVKSAATFIGKRDADFNGDGLLDAVVLYGGGDMRFQFFHKGNTKHRLYMVADGLNNKTIIDYQCTTEYSAYEASSTACTFPYVKFNGPMYVVSQVQQSNGLGGYFETTYKYKGGIKFKALDSFLGFLQIDATSSETQLTRRTTNVFDTSLPALSKITRSLLNSQGSEKSKTESDYTITGLTGKRFSLYLHYRNTWDNFNNTTTNSTFWVDGNGNRTHEQTITGSGSASTDTYYENYSTVAGAPVPNVPQTIRTVRIQDGNPAFERKVTINYNTANGFVNSKVIDPDKTNPLTITYIPVSNGLGLVWKEQVSGADITTRETVNQWDTQGRFIVKQWAPEGQLVETTYDSKTGNVTQVKKPTGYIDVSTYDGFGRLTYNKSSDQTITLSWYSGSLANCVYYTDQSGTSHPKTLTYYDRLGRELESQTQAFESGKEILVSKSYNSKGQAASVSAPYFSGGTAYNTVFTYDEYGRLLREDYAGGSQITNYAYSAKQLVTTSTSVAPSRTETRQFNDLGQVVGITDTRGNHLGYDYHSSGQVETVTTDDGSVSTQFEGHGWPIQVVDPDLGTTTYTYFATGELKSRSRNGKTTSYTYNRNGQIKTITEPEGTTTYTYDSTTGLLSSVSGIGNTGSTLGYDNTGRLTSRAEKVDGVSYTYGYTYADSYTNRLSKTTYPGSFAVTYNYSNGYLWEIHNNADNSLIWQLQETSPRNHIEKYKNGNNLVTTRTYDYKTGMISQLQTGSIQNWQYSFDEATGNLNWRKDVIHNLQENFTYDNLDRLTAITSGGNTVNINLDENGNIISKGDLGTYQYTAPQPHAISALVPTAGYSPEAQIATYTSFDKMKTLSQGNKNLAVTYGYDHARRKTVYTDGSTTKTKLFIPGGYEKLTEGSTTREFYYISTPAGTTSVYEKVNGSGSMYYIHPDYLGSFNLVTNASGGTVQELGFDAWGRQRNAGNWTYSNLPAPKFERGYTGHEYLAGFDLVNMNGRVYDPMLGRFLSPDPTLQAPGNLQDYNRYSYVLNNPLKYTDPTGYQLYSYGTTEGSATYDGSGSVFGIVSGGGTGSSFGPAGYGINGSGLDGVYYDWYTGTYRSTHGGWNVGSEYAQSIAQDYGTRYTVTETAYSLDGGKTFIGNGNYSIVKVTDNIVATGGTFWLPAMTGNAVSERDKTKYSGALTDIITIVGGSSSIYSNFLAFINPIINKHYEKLLPKYGTTFGVLGNIGDGAATLGAAYNLKNDPYNPESYADMITAILGWWPVVGDINAILYMGAKSQVYQIKENIANNLNPIQNVYVPATGDVLCY